MERSYESSWALARHAEGPLLAKAVQIRFKASIDDLDAFVSSLIEQRYSAWCVHLKPAVPLTSAAGRSHQDIGGARRILGYQGTTC